MQGRRKVRKFRRASNVVGIICPLIEIGLTYLPTSRGGGGEDPPAHGSDGFVFMPMRFVSPSLNHVDLISSIVNSPTKA